MWLFALPWCLVSAGLFVPRWSYRIASIVLIVFPIPTAVIDYQGSIKLKHFFEQKALQQQALPHQFDETR